MMHLQFQTVAFLALVGWVAASALPEPEEGNLNYLSMDELNDLVFADGIYGPNVNTDPKHTKMVIASILYHYDNDKHDKSLVTDQTVRRGDKILFEMLLEIDTLAVGNCNTKFFCNLEYLTETVLIASQPLYAYAKDAQQKQIDFCQKNSDLKSLPQFHECS